MESQRIVDRTFFAVMLCVQALPPMASPGGRAARRDGPGHPHASYSQRGYDGLTVAVEPTSMHSPGYVFDGCSAGVVLCGRLCRVSTPVSHVPSVRGRAHRFQ